MFKVSIYITALILFVASSALCQSFILIEVEGDNTSALLQNIDTGEEWWAAVGDEIEGWIVYEIGQEGVTIIQPREDLPMLMKKLSVGTNLQPVKVE